MICKIFPKVVDVLDLTQLFDVVKNFFNFRGSLVFLDRLDMGHDDPSSFFLNLIYGIGNQFPCKKSFQIVKDELSHRNPGLIGGTSIVRLKNNLVH